MIRSDIQESVSGASLGIVTAAAAKLASAIKRRGLNDSSGRTIRHAVMIARGVIQASALGASVSGAGLDDLGNVQVFHFFFLAFCFLF